MDIFIWISPFYIPFTLYLYSLSNQKLGRIRIRGDQKVKKTFSFSCFTANHSPVIGQEYLICIDLSGILSFFFLNATLFLNYSKQSSRQLVLQGDRTLAWQQWAEHFTPCHFVNWPERAASERSAGHYRCCCSPAASVITELCTCLLWSSAQALESGNNLKRSTLLTL